MSAVNLIGLILAVLFTAFLVIALIVPGEVLMSDTLAGVLFIASLIVALGLVQRPLGDYMATVLTSQEALACREGDLPGRRHRRRGRADAWRYLRSVLAFSVASVGFLYVFLRVQQHFWPPYAVPKMTSDQAFNTAASFVTNTNWQSYSGESALGYVVQMAGLAVQNFVSAAVGIAVAIALVRGFARNRTDQLGNFWVDLTRICLRHPAADLDRVRDRLRRRRHDPELPRLRDVAHDRGRHADHPRRPVRQPGGDQGARHQRRRLLQRQLRASRSRTRPRGRTGSRSSCCCASASRCRARSACWSATCARDGRSSR